MFGKADLDPRRKTSLDLINFLKTLKGPKLGISCLISVEEVSMLTFLSEHKHFKNVEQITELAKILISQEVSFKIRCLSLSLLSNDDDTSLLNIGLFNDPFPEVITVC
jgi:hypothetical protein